MLHVVGGTYHENCREGEWSQLFGSGLRAAAALQNAGFPVELTTYVGQSDRELAEVMASTFGLALSPTEIPVTVKFQYMHALSVPSILPPVQLIEAADPLSVQGDNILRFGLVEGDAVVSGKRVVYDPQSAYEPRRFRDNESSAEELAIVCNRREAQLLTGLSAVEDAGRELLAAESTSVVCIKCGSHGALVVQNSSVDHVPAFNTQRVWALGSGDVFAAVFAKAWAVDEQTAVNAATEASMAAAYYCESRALPIPFPIDQECTFTQIQQASPRTSQTPLVYLAGPFFDMMQRWLINEARDALLDQGLRVFSPYHDVGLGVADQVVPADITAIEGSAVMFAVLDHLDSGTLFEVGYARAKGIPVVGFAQNVNAESLKMLTGTACDVYDDFVTAIYKVMWTVSG